MLIDYSIHSKESINLLSPTKSVNTICRAKILITIFAKEFTTVKYFTMFGLNKNTIRKILREFNKDQLVLERFSLYRITAMGVDLVEKLLIDRNLQEWSQQYFNIQEIMIPKILKL